MQVTADEDFTAVRECQVLKFRSGEVIGGDLAGYLLASGAPVSAEKKSPSPPPGGKGEGAEVVPEDGEVPPPLAGRGSSREAWAAYAATLGVTVASDASRDEIVDAVRVAGVRVE
jgi:hypothetical protein